MQAHLQRASNKHRGQGNNRRQSQRLNTSRTLLVFLQTVAAHAHGAGEEIIIVALYFVYITVCVSWNVGGEGKNPPETLFIPGCETGARRQHFVNTRPIKIKNLVSQLASGSPEMPRKQRRTHKKFKSRLVSRISVSDRPGPVWILNSLLVLLSQSASARRRRGKGKTTKQQKWPRLSRIQHELCSNHP